jgi:RecA-family ATPase
MARRRESFFIIGACIAATTGQHMFIGRKVNAHGPIVYVTTEGLHDHYSRMSAYQKLHGVSVNDDNYIVIPDAMNLMQSSDRHALLKTIDWEMGKIKQQPLMVIFDTLSRIIPGADENSQKEMSLFVKAETEVLQAFNTTSLLAHHLSRSGDGNMRGSTVIEGSADTIILMKREKGQEIGTLTMAKAKSAPDGWEMDFRLKDVDLDGFRSSLAIHVSVA